MPWTLPTCTCPRDDSGDTRGCEKHDSRSDWNHNVEFYCDGVPCESCGKPCDARTWHQDSELWIGTECSCTIPDQPVCPDLIPLIQTALTVQDLLRVCKAHRKSCRKCNPVLPLPVKREPGQVVPVKVPEAA